MLGILSNFNGSGALTLMICSTHCPIFVPVWKKYDICVSQQNVLGFFVYLVIGEGKPVE